MAKAIHHKKVIFYSIQGLIKDYLQKHKVRKSSKKAHINSNDSQKKPS
jgi:hypothetical protein